MRSIPQTMLPLPNQLPFGIPLLDQKLAAVQAGKFTVFYGSPYCISLSLLLSVRCQLPPEEGGFGSSVIFVDGGNTFNPYSVSSTARKYNLNPRSALQHIFISRVFTAYQLTSLVVEKLNQALRDFESRLVVISDMTSLFLDRDIPKTEAKLMFNKLTLHLFELASKKKLAVLATHIPRFDQDLALESADGAVARADILTKLEEDNQFLKFVFGKTS